MGTGVDFGEAAQIVNTSESDIKNLEEISVGEKLSDEDNAKTSTYEYDKAIIIERDGFDEDSEQFRLEMESSESGYYVSIRYNLEK